jgi:hypothetical protein
VSRPSRDVNELIFRVLFSSIFLGLGGEHIVDDRLIPSSPGSSC